jgi:tetratricopeptide (TPR) repeat protein
MPTHHRSSLAAASMLAQATALERAGCLVEARLAYQNALDRNGSNIEALVGLGRIELQAQRPYAARLYFEKAVKISPRAAQLRNYLAIAFLDLGRPDKAAGQALRSYKLDKSSIETLDILHKVSRYLGRSAEAEFYLQTALTLRPGDPTLTLKLASHYDLSSEPQKAQALYRGLIDRGHASAQAYYGLVGLEKFRAEPPELGAIEELLLETRTSPADREILHRAAGKIADDLGRYEEAFAHFSAAGRSLAWLNDAEEVSERIQRMKEVVTLRAFAEREGFGNKSQRPVFVFGMPRSGTTLVEQILASHPEVHGAGELTFFRHEVTHLSHSHDLTQSKARKIAREYLRLLSAHSPTAKRVVDKMPYNFERLSVLALLFPNASFIHCRRNPLATCVSCFMRPLRRTYVYAGDLGTLGRYYRQYDELMAWWRQSLPVQIFDIDYEQLVLNTEAESRRLIAYIGLEWTDACLRFHETKRLVMTPSRRQVEQPIYTSSLDAWQNYEKHLGPLFQALGDLVPL